MIGQIGHLGKASPRTAIASILLYALGATAGAAAVGACLGLIGAALRWIIGVPPGGSGPGMVLLAAALAGAGGLRDLGLVRVRLPEAARQVPRAWLAVFGPYRAGLFWGLDIGSGYSTMIRYSGPYVLGMCLLLLGSPAFGALVLGLYGLAHGGFMTADILAECVGPAGRHGLMGFSRTPKLYRVSGVAHLAVAAWLVTCGMA